MKRKLIVLTEIAAAAIVVAALGYAGWRWWSGSDDAAPQFRTAEIRVADVVFTISATGTIVPEETIDVGAQVNGMIARFGAGTDGHPVDYRSAVAEGALLARIDDALYAADVASAEAQLAQAESLVRLGEANREQARARLVQSQQDLARAEKLGPSEALAQADYDAIRSAHDQAVAAVAVAEAQIGQGRAQVASAGASLSRARRNLAYCDITSPVSGVIIDKRVDVGQTVVASLNAPSLFLIAKDLRRMLVLVQVNEADILRVKPGADATFTVDAVPERVFRGTVRKVRLNAAITQNVVTYTVEVAADNADLALLPYLTANVTFSAGRQEQAMVVPNAALRFMPTGAAAEPTSRAAGARASAATSARGRIWILDEQGKPRMIRVKTGMSDGTVTAIESGELSEGVEVVVAQVVAGQSAADSGAQDASTNPFTPKLFRR